MATLNRAIQSHLLIVDEDHEMRDALSRHLESQGNACELTADASRALDLIGRQPFDLVICDAFGGMPALELLDKIKRIHPSLPVVVSGAGGVTEAVEAIKHGAFGYAVKPFSVEHVQNIVAGALASRQRSSDNWSAWSAPPDADELELVGTAPAMRVLQATIDLVARSSAPVLVSGETGVGKELVARAIHARGPRSGRPFIAVNTSAIPQELLEGEIFGHARGGFTGAIHARKGLLTEADGGTLLLDEIGDMPFGLQAKLLRVLQFGEIRPVGSDRVHHVDVRIISSTHRDLAALVRQGLFREDLYFRLDVLSVPVPPLRDRVEDIPALAAHFLLQARKRAPDSPVRSISRETLRSLAKRPWPGNLRELASAIERAVVFGLDEAVDPRHFPAPPVQATATAWPCSAQSPWTLERLSHAYAEWVLALAGGNKQRAAEILGIDLSTLYRWRRHRPD
jgi:two-component system response regulator HydG